jgi:hypothetical protein
MQGRKDRAGGVFRPALPKTELHKLSFGQILKQRVE